MYFSTIKITERGERGGPVEPEAATESRKDALELLRWNCPCSSPHEEKIICYGGMFQAFFWRAELRQDFGLLLEPSLAPSPKLWLHELWGSLLRSFLGDVSQSHSVGGCERCLRLDGGWQTQHSTGHSALFCHWQNTVSVTVVTVDGAVETSGSFWREVTVLLAELNCQGCVNLSQQTG